MNKENAKKVRIKVRLTEEENEKLKCCAAACGLSQAEFIRQLCKGKTPKPQPTKEFWKLMNTLYYVHNGFKECIKYEPSALNICKEIECLILELQEAG
ncbi:MAG: CopG family transcriptional regulator [Lachnospiraceae bacterium]|nr:CopG family transcriptional regulator [Lachnospiraceae bacterium]